MNLFLNFFINKRKQKREITIQNNNFMSLYGFDFVISDLRRISFDITSHINKIQKYRELHNNNCYHLIEFALILINNLKIDLNLKYKKLN